MAIMSKRHYARHCKTVTWYRKSDPENSRGQPQFAKGLSIQSSVMFEHNRSFFSQLRLD
jgi:hypothetical protein